MWARFGEWSTCDKVCDEGEKSRSRECLLNGEATDVAACGNGLESYVLACNKHACHREYSRSSVIVTSNTLISPQ